MQNNILFFNSCANSSLDTFPLAVGRAFMDELRSNVDSFTIREYKLEQDEHIQKDLSEAAYIILVNEEADGVSVQMFTRHTENKNENVDETLSNNDDTMTNWNLPEEIMVNYYLHEGHYVTDSSLLNAVGDTRRAARRFSRLIEN